MGNKSNALRRIAFWLKARALGRTSLEKGSLSVVLRRVRQERLHKERQLVISYQAIKTEKPGFSISTPKRITAAFLTFVLIITAFTVTNFGSVSGATFTFVQTDWAGGTDGGVYPAHPTNQTGWNKYDSKDAGVATNSGNLTLTPTNGSSTHTSDGEFNAGTKVNVSVASGDVKLSGGAPSLSVTSTTGTPQSRWGHAMAWDTVNNRVLMFGGSNVADQVLNSYNPANTTWSTLSPSGTAPAAGWVAGAWDNTNNKFWVINGSTMKGYNPSSNAWENTTSTNAPTEADGDSMVWDSTDQRLYFIKQNAATMKYYTPSNDTWTTVTPVSPPTTVITPAVYDSVNNRILRFDFSGNLHSFNPSNSTWSTLSPTGTPPGSGRVGNAIAFNPANATMYIYGGDGGPCGAGGEFSDVWAYDTSTNAWTNTHANCNSTGERFYLAATWDTTNNAMIAFGGYNGSPFDETDTMYVGFSTSGTFTSAIMDLGQASALGTFNFTSSTPANTTLRFQIRSATTSGGVSSATYYGPTGTGDYYTSSGTTINSVHLGHRHFQVRALLDTTNSSATPTLSDYTINFTYYPAAATLTGSPYDTTDSNNALGRVQWTESLPAGTDVKFQVRTAPSSANDYVYGVVGNSNAFYRYSISGNSWTSLAATPLAIGQGGALVRAGDYIYAFRGSNSTTFYRYSISGDSWSTMTAAPESIGSGFNASSLVYPGSGDYIYAGRVADTDFWRYSISGNSWTTLASTPTTIGGGASFASNGGDHIYVNQSGGASGFWRYSISGNSWTTLASPPTTTQNDSPMAYTGGDYLYVLRGAGNTTFYRYSISGNSWSTMTATPAGIGAGGSLVYPLAGDYLYAFGGGSTAFYRYSISGNSWTSMTSVPLTVANGGALASWANWTSWMGPDGTSSSYFIDQSGGEAIPSALTTGNNDQWIQYKAFLSSTDTSLTPTLSDVTISYVGNGPPSVTNVSASLGANGDLTVGYDLADADSANSTIAVAASFGVTLNGAITNSATSLTVSSATSLPSTGSIFIDSEEILYGSKSGNTLNSLTRGQNNTSAAAHSDGVTVFLKAATVTGNVGAAVANGTGKSAAWTLASDLTNVSTSTGQVKVIANDGNLVNQIGTGTASNVTLDTTAPTTVLSAGSFVQASATSSTAVAISWVTNEQSNASVDYGTTTAYGTTATNATMSTSHSVSITGLTPQTQYYYRIRSTDAYSNTLTDDNGGESYTFTTPSSDAGASRPVDETPPVITNVQVINIATNGVTIIWTTDEESSSIVNYGLTNTYGSLAGVPDIFVTSHQVLISGLIPGTVYNYQVVSLDRNSNRTASTNTTFTTATATGTGSGDGDGTGSGESADVLEEQVNQLTNANNALNTQINELNAKLGSAISEDEKRGILRDLENLRSEIDNNIRRISELSKFKERFDAQESRIKQLESQLSDITNKILGIKEGETLSPADILKTVSLKFAEITRVFKTSATVAQKRALEDTIGDTTATLRELSELVPPAQILTRPGVTVGATEAVITWSTDKPALGAVLFSDAASFEDGKYSSNIADGSDYKTEHQVVLTNLIPATIYHYQLRVKSEAGVESNSSDFTFTTKTAIPVISNARFSRVDEKTISFSWLTSLPADSVVTYTPLINGVLDTKSSKSEGSPELDREHLVTVGDLLPATTYEITVSSSDAFGSTVSEKLGRIVTSEDKIAPVISQVRTEITVVPGSKANKVQAIVSWKTDEPATTQVFYDQGASNTETLKDASTLSSELTFNHIAVITNWEPGTIYRFRTISKDESGNESQSKTFTVLTPRQKATVVDLIIDNFSDIFGWTKGIK